MEMSHRRRESRNCSNMVGLKDYIVELATVDTVRPFVEKWHYSGSILGINNTYSFRLIRPDGVMVGAMIYGKMSMAGAYKKYGDREIEVIELRRLCCIDDTPKNTESYFIGATLRWLRDNTIIKTVVSYADPHHGHKGIIYKASNFDYLGTTSKGKLIEWNGETYHDHVIRHIDDAGNRRPHAKRIKQALDLGEAKYITTPGKHIYRYNLQPSAKVAMSSW